MPWKKVAIVGVGLLGGSVGLALRKRKLAREVVGVGRRASSLRKARECGAVTATTTHLAKGVSGAELIVVCTPVETIVPTVLEAARYCTDSTLLTDVGSTKSAIVAEIDRAPELRQSGAHFIGSHPLAGSEKTGPQAARANLFVGRVAIVTPSRKSREEKVARLEAFWRSLGATVIRQTPQAHDQSVAAISHLPHLLAAALAAGTPPSLLPLVAGGWMDTTRVAAGDVELWRQILSDNRGHVLKSLDKFEKVLASFRDALESEDDSELVRLLELGKQKRDAVGN